MLYIKGEEMSAHVMERIVASWIAPAFETADSWSTFDLSAARRDACGDSDLLELIELGKTVGVVFKEPTVTPTVSQAKAMGLTDPKTWGSPNGALRKGWGGVAIVRETIAVDGLELGFAKPVHVSRHAVGGEYNGSYKQCAGSGTVRVTFTPDSDGDGGRTGEDEQVIAVRRLTGAQNAVVCYTNPYDNVTALGRSFFSRCLTLRLRPAVVTKQTVFKWQAPFWEILERLFEAEYRPIFVSAGLVREGEPLTHLLSDAATMCVVRWSPEGGFGMCALNYDGDLLTDELAEVHGGPAFLTSVLHGVLEAERASSEDPSGPSGSDSLSDAWPNSDGESEDLAEGGGAVQQEMRMYEACHGTIADAWLAYQKGSPTRVNCLGLAEGLLAAMADAEAVQLQHRQAAGGAGGGGGGGGEEDVVAWPVEAFVTEARRAMHSELAASCLCPVSLSVSEVGCCGECGKQNWTTDSLIDAVAVRLHGA